MPFVPFDPPPSKLRREHSEIDTPAQLDRLIGTQRLDPSRAFPLGPESQSVVDAAANAIRKAMQRGDPLGFFRHRKL